MSGAVGTLVRAAAAVVLCLAVGCTDRGESLRTDSPDPRAVAFAERMQAAVRASDMRGALALADSALRYDPDLVAVHLSRGELYTRLRRYDEAEEALRAALARDPTRRGAWYALGHNAFVQERYREALGYYVRERALVASILAEQEDARATFGADALPSLHAQIGRTYAKLGVRDSARQAYDAALVASPTLAVAHAWLSEWYEEAGHEKAAFNHAFQALRSDRENLDYVYRVGRLYLARGDVSAAVPLLRHVVQRAPAHEGATYNLGRALVASGRADEGRALLERVDELKGLQRDALLAERAVTIYPRDADRWVTLAGLMVRRGELDKAEEAFRAAVALRPAELALHTDLANVHIARGDTLAARRRLEAVVRADTAFTPAWLNLGILYAATGDAEAARRAWETVLRHDPRDADARAYLTRLSAR